MFKKCFFDLFYLSGASPNNYCLIKPLIPLKIKGFLKKDEGFVVGYTFKIIDDFFNEPVKSSEVLNIIKVNTIDDEPKTFSIKDVLCKVLALPYGEDLVLIPILHHCVD